MCGISGLADFRSIVDPAEVHAMIATLHHRGPDHSGVYMSDHVGLGHARLSIIDLTPAGNQPMVSADGNTVLVFNGEAYNFRELRRELEAQGAAFRGHSDSEVVLAAYEFWGTGAFSRIKGMFALALWDKRSAELHLVRDRFGIKPLYYHLMPDGIVFGSEIKALLVTKRVPRAIGWQGLHEYMWYGNTIGESTTFDSIAKLAPGHCLTVHRGGRKLWEYWAIEDVAPVRSTVAEATEEVRRRLEASVASHLVSDVPVGIFLSGGIDSSAITAFASRMSAAPLHTYSVGFDFERGINELAKARRVATHYATEHHEVHIAGRDMPSVIERLVRCHDEPFADAANIPLYLLCEQLRGSVKVVLQGDGGDEMFAGYRRYNVLKHESFWQLTSSIALAASRIAPRNPSYYRKVRFLSAMAQRDAAMRMALLLTVETLRDPPTRILSDDYRELLARADPFAVYRRMNERFADHDSVQKMLYTDSSVLLPNTFLEKVDKSTMAHSIEVRVPFLDTDLASYAMGLPANLKVKGFNKKWILRRALRGIVPPDILDGPKTGFGVPYEHWLKEPLANYMKSVLFDPYIANAGIFDTNALAHAVSQHVNGWRDNGFLLWKALQLALWYRNVFARC